ncbi:MAG: hypothetical protein M1820_005591 [Bogoriella megaspora]|nr:MAG: hypothetical protein M1820_005591 [Bogoriella megaspora]
MPPDQRARSNSQNRLKKRPGFFDLQGTRRSEVKGVSYPALPCLPVTQVLTFLLWSDALHSPPPPTPPLNMSTLRLAKSSFNLRSRQSEEQQRAAMPPSSPEQEGSTSPKRIPFQENRSKAFRHLGIAPSFSDLRSFNQIAPAPKTERLPPSTTSGGRSSASGSTKALKHEELSGYNTQPERSSTSALASATSSHPSGGEYVLPALDFGRSRRPPHARARALTKPAGSIPQFDKSIFRDPVPRPLDAEAPVSPTNAQDPRLLSTRYLEKSSSMPLNVDPLSSQSPVVTKSQGVPRSSGHPPKRLAHRSKSTSKAGSPASSSPANSSTSLLASATRPGPGSRSVTADSAKALPVFKPTSTASGPRAARPIQVNVSRPLPTLPPAEGRRRRDSITATSPSLQANTPSNTPVPTTTEAAIRRSDSLSSINSSNYAGSEAEICEVERRVTFYRYASKPRLIMISSPKEEEEEEGEGAGKGKGKKVLGFLKGKKGKGKGKPE